MNQTLTADDLLPLVLKLPRDEQKRLAQLALEAAARNASAADQPGHPFTGTYVDGGYRETVKNPGGNSIASGTIGLEKGQRILRLKGTDGHNQRKFTVKAYARDVGSDEFTGKWWWDGETTRYELKLKQYGDPAGEFALVGSYDDDIPAREQYFWNLQLHPLEQ